VVVTTFPGFTMLATLSALSMLAGTFGACMLTGSP
jgi:hypothetical protein